MTAKSSRNQGKANKVEKEPVRATGPESSVSKPRPPRRSPEALEPDVKAVVDRITSSQKPVRHSVIADIFRTATKMAMEGFGTLNLKITATTLRELRFSFRTFYPHRMTPKITMFGSARVPEGTELYEFAKDFARKAVERKFMIITGGGPGIMAAGNEGAQNSGFGLNIRLPFEQEPNPHIDQDGMLINYKYFFTRKLFLVKEASGFAFFPGGFGTFDEAFEVMTLLQTGKTSLIPVVLVEPPGFGFWTEFMVYFQKVLLKKGFVSDSDRSLFRVFHSPDQALDHLIHFYRVYHSMRFVRDDLVIRLKKPLSAALVRELEQKFGRMMRGPIRQTGPLPEEANEPEWDALPRLVFAFDRKDYGGLRQMIDHINDKGPT